MRGGRRAVAALAALASASGPLIVAPQNPAFAAAASGAAIVATQNPALAAAAFGAVLVATRGPALAAAASGGALAATRNSAFAVSASGVAVVATRNPASALAASASGSAGNAARRLALTAVGGGGNDPAPVSVVLRAVNPEDSQWVSVRWRTGRPVCHFRLAVWDNRNVEVDYPGSRGFAVLSRGGTLRPGGIDYTAFRVTPHYDRPVWALLAATISYDHCGADPRTVSRSTGLLLPVRG